LYLEASTSSGSSSLTRRSATIAGWRQRALSSKLSLASRREDPAFLRDDQRIDLGQRGVAGQVEREEAADQAAAA